MSRSPWRLPAVVLAAFASPAASAETPHFTVRDAILAEWARQPIPFDDKARAALPPEDRARLLRAEQRIGAPGAPPLLPPELDRPDVATWEALAKKAKTPAERFTALHFLNRLKSTHALSALDGLTAADAKAWPRHLHLEAHVATARLRGEVIGPGLQQFLAALPVNAVRAQAARLRLVLEGKETSLLPPLPPRPGAVLALLDGWNRAPWDARATAHLALIDLVFSQYDGPEPLLAAMRAPLSPWHRTGMRAPSLLELARLMEGLMIRVLDGVPDRAPERVGTKVRPTLVSSSPGVRRGGLAVLGNSGDRAGLADAARRIEKVNEQVALLPALRKVNPDRADALRARLLAGSDPIGRAVAVEDLAEPPADLDALARRVFADLEVDALQALVSALDRWKLAPERRRTVLSPFLLHATWIGRREAWKALSAIDPMTHWPAAPERTATEQAIVDEAVRLAEAARPIRLRIRFSEKRTIVLRLDPVNAPINVGNLVTLARNGFFNGRRVPRVVPDFVVQMGSPLDNMDGGPGYAVRCEDSLDWYGPGSVGMALSGKDTGGSQFFITTNAAPHLTGRYTRLGTVEDPDRALPLLDDLELGAQIEKIEVLP